MKVPQPLLVLHGLHTLEEYWWCILHSVPQFAFFWCLPVIFLKTFTPGKWKFPLHAEISKPQEYHRRLAVLWAAIKAGLGKIFSYPPIADLHQALCLYPGSYQSLLSTWIAYHPWFNEFSLKKEGCKTNVLIHIRRCWTQRHTLSLFPMSSVCEIWALSYWFSIQNIIFLGFWIPYRRLGAIYHIICSLLCNTFPTHSVPSPIPFLLAPYLGKSYQHPIIINRSVHQEGQERNL